MRRNLPPQAEPWGREIDSRLKALERQQRNTNDDVANALQGVNATVSQLSRQILTLQDLTEELSKQQKALQEQQDYLSSLVSRNAGTGFWSASWHSLGKPPEGQWQWHPGPSLTMEIPTGKARIYLRSDRVTVARNQVCGAVLAGITYGVSGGVLAPGQNMMRLGVPYASTSSGVTSGLTRFGTLTMTPGTYTFTGYYGMVAYEPSDVDGQSVSFEDLAIVVEVVNPD